MVFNTNYDRDKVDHSEPEINPGPRLVETAGYLPMAKLIKLMELEGAELVKAREEMYEALDAEVLVDLPIDPTHSPGFDLADASIIKRTLQGKAARKAPDVEEKLEPVVKEAAKQA